MLERLIRETDALADLTGDTLLVLDRDGIILHATQAAGQLLGTPAGQLTGTAFGLPLDGGRQSPVRLVANGRRARMRAQPLAEPDLGLTRVLLRDVTDQEEALERLDAAKKAARAGERAKSHFLANITHEIRTPMIGILGMTELTLATELSAKQREYLEMARHSARSLLTVLNDIVDYARIEVGALELAQLPFDLHDTVEEAVSVFRPLAAKKGLALEYRLLGDLPRALVGDASRLRQILINLVGNAVKFTDSGSVILAVSAGEAGPAGRTQLRFAVRDTGIGIPRDKIKAIFDSFTQADVSPARRYQGAGLGLAIVRHLVEMQGGHYGVESEEGQGSVFSFVLDFALPAEAQPETAVARPAPQAPPATRPLTVLLAEDNPINQIYAQELLEADGHGVVVAHTGRRALEWLRRRHFDVVLMDIQMPEMDGLEATRAIRSDQSGDFDPDIPIVALTAHALKGDREAFLRAGMNEYLSKPVSPESLAAALARAMGATAPAAPQSPDMTPGAGHELLDWQELLTKARGNTGFLMKLFSAFVAEQPTSLEAIREALARADFEHLAFLAHSLKGAAATMCAKHLRQACYDLELAAKARDAGRAGAALTGLEERLRHVLMAMRERLDAQDGTAKEPGHRPLPTAGPTL